MAPLPAEPAIERFLDAIYRASGHDFRDYAEASRTRRLTLWLQRSPFGSFQEAQEALARDPALLEGLVEGLTVNVTEMFRDPGFFQALRSEVVPHLLTHPHVRIWLAGCASGEEAYSVAILLNEEGLAGRFRIYATDVNPQVLETAKAGILPLRPMRQFTRNYQLGGGRGCFADYYTARYDRALLEPSLKDAIVFAAHNLATDSDFAEMHLILCRNVLIYFKPPLRERALGLFDASLPGGGFLCLGLKESLAHTGLARTYRELPGRQRIYRKRYDLPG
jgi:chemotaxis protein methyltransferase CheR